MRDLLSDLRQTGVNPQNGIGPMGKRTGAVYTPSALAYFLSNWAVRPEARVLEPSAGDGQFVQAVTATGQARELYAIELDPSASEVARTRGDGSTITYTGDFFAWYRSNHYDGTFDAVVGNPPFIRYQNFLEEHREPAFALMREEGLNPTRLTNAWLPFVVVATKALREGGRFAMVLPAELLQVNYARELREFLAKKYEQLHIITFRKLLFEGVEQETLLLLGERRDSSDGAEISFTEIEDCGALTDQVLRKSSSVHADIVHARDKWTQFFLSPKEFSLIQEIEATSPNRLGDYAEVDVGIVTGRNQFFVVTRRTAADFGLTEQCLPLVGKSAHVKGLLLREDDWKLLMQAETPCLLVQLGPDDRAELSDAGLAYVQMGEAAGYHTGYKCRVRAPNWWNVPSVWTPDAFMTRQIYDGPRIVVNHTAAVCTDTIHRLRTRPGVDPRQLAAVSINSLTWAFSEIKGRSYGGGVLELEPREAEDLPLPLTPGSRFLDLEELDAAARNGEGAIARDVVDNVVLREFGLSSNEIKMLKAIWVRLSTRRMERR
ncbi:MAG: class I SAM-dependent methyltransferase [Chloroflexi bacterium]|nr:class I SAM-dependent methyltransferase [Chloroflexota bacterium]